MHDLIFENEFTDLEGLSFELETACPVCHIEDMDKDFMEHLAKLYARYPFHINSAYRTASWEKTHGRDGTSSHTKGLAVDIRCTDSHQRLVLLRLAIENGFTRIGIGERFIHLDDDHDKPSCVWLYTK